MGIALKEILAQDYFTDCNVVAGFKGLNREVQGVAIMDAPDSLKWSRGKELIITSGYSIAQEPGCVEEAFREGYILRSSALMIKRHRHLAHIPQEILDLCNKYDFPLISIPYEVPYMEILNQVNVVALNRAIRRFSIRDSIAKFNSITYKEQQIHQILSAVETEMNFPAFIYDLESGTKFYSSNNFKKMTQNFGLTETDYWQPSKECSRTTLCDYMHMERIRLVDNLNPDGPRISWILIPIQINGYTKAYFVVMEAKEFLDYLDEYSIRISYVMLQSVYEQIIATQNMGSIGFENLVLYALHYDPNDPGRLIYQGNTQGITMDALYSCIRFRQINADSIARSEKEIIIETFRTCRIGQLGRLAFIDKNDGIILIESELLDKVSRDEITEMCNELSRAIARICPALDFEFGIHLKGLAFTAMSDMIEKCNKAIEIGKKVTPGAQIWYYESLGPLAWLNIPEDEYDALVTDYLPLASNENDRILLETLKAYLENNMNFSATANKMYVHINTVRKRIDKIDEMLKIDWDNHISRLKIQLILALLDIGEKKE